MNPDPVHQDDVAEDEHPVDAVPDEVLLMIFSFLDNGDVVRAGGVCRRWRRVALSGAAWRRRELDDGGRLLKAWRPWTVRTDKERRRRQQDEGRLRSLVRTVLGEAPCVRKLVISTTPALPIGDIRCSATELDFQPSLKPAADLLKKLLQRLAELGGLKKLTVLKSDLDMALLVAIYQSGIEELEVTDTEWRDPSFSSSYHGWFTTAVLPRPHAAARLKTLKVGGTTSDGVVRYIVIANGATLEEVSFFSARIPAELLAQHCPNLRRLEGVDAEGKAGLLRRTRLEELDLSHHPYDNPSDFPQGATELRRLTVRWLARDSSAPMNWLETVDSKSELVYLRIVRLAVPDYSNINLSYPTHLVPWPNPAFWERLGVAVRRLRRLEELELDFKWGPAGGTGDPGEPAQPLPPVDFLLAVAPRQVLRVTVTLRCPGHELRVQPLLTRGHQLLTQLLERAACAPGLHLAGIQAECPHSAEDGAGPLGARCPWWAKHAPASMHPVRHMEVVNLYSHADSEPCGRHTGPGRWLRCAPRD